MRQTSNVKGAENDVRGMGGGHDGGDQRRYVIVGSSRNGFGVGYDRYFTAQGLELAQ
jgi:hypothetical protein